MGSKREKGKEKRKKKKEKRKKKKEKRKKKKEKRKKKKEKRKKKKEKRKKKKEKRKKKKEKRKKEGNNHLVLILRGINFVRRGKEIEWWDEWRGKIEGEGMILGHGFLIFFPFFFFGGVEVGKTGRGRRLSVAISFFFFFISD